MVRQTKSGYAFAPLLIQHIRFLQPHALTEAEKFNLLYPDPSQISTVSDKLRYFRYRKALRQRDVADYAGINRTTYAEYEKGIDFIPLDNLKRIADLLEVDIRELLIDDYSRFLYEGQGQQIRALRKRMKLTQNEFGQYMGVHGGTVKKWEADRIQIQRETYERLSSLVG